MDIVLSKNCKRVKYLNDSAIIYKLSIDFKNGQITRMRTTDYLTFDFNKWTSRRDSLVGWIDKNHPELNGFINDQTIAGGQKYLKAIDLFKHAK